MYGFEEKVRLGEEIEKLNKEVKDALKCSLLDSDASIDTIKGAAVVFNCLDLIAKLGHEEDRRYAEITEKLDRLTEIVEKD